MGQTRRSTRQARRLGSMRPNSWSHATKTEVEFQFGLVILLQGGLGRVKANKRPPRHVFDSANNFPNMRHGRLWPLHPS